MDFRLHIASWLATETSLSQEEIDAWIEIPPQPQLGDYAFPCFRLAKHLRRSPVQIADELARKAKDAVSDLHDVQAINGYLNFFVDRSSYNSSVLKRVLSAGDTLGMDTIGEGKTVIVEFSSPNIAKPFHVGHAFTTILGNALYRIYDRLGYKTIRVNHLGDYGTQFGKLIVAYRLWVDHEKLAASPIDELLRIYVRFHEEAKSNPELDEQAREAFRRLESGSIEEKALWQKIRDLSLKAFELIYERLGVSFDSYRGESFHSDQIPAVVQWLESKHLLTTSDGAQVVMLDEYGLPPCIILKSDGTTIYASRDIAAVLYRWEQYQFAKNLYVVGTTQALHFQQVFAVLDKAGLEAAKQCEHIGFGLVKFPDRKLSTRSGDVVLLSDLLQESVDKTKEIIRQNSLVRNVSMSDDEINAVAEKIGVGAVVYTFLRNGRERDIVFSWEEMLDFEGDSAPYVQYTYARARSILRKADMDESITEPVSESRLKRLTTDDEFALAKLLDDFDQTLQKAVKQNEPYLVIRYVTALARSFNKYYNHEPILKTDGAELRLARLNLVQAVCLTIRTALELVGIAVVERM
ncbi:MAG: arginine--tRNA ligase [Eubacteriales bacterium]|nr:arginine--tRNA ligase [Eubacteriales bacterium]